jgi:hypothetical protein
MISAPRPLFALGRHRPAMFEVSPAFSPGCYLLAAPQRLAATRMIQGKKHKESARAEGRHRMPAMTAIRASGRPPARGRAKGRIHGPLKGRATRLVILIGLNALSEFRLRGLLLLANRYTQWL